MVCKIRGVSLWGQSNSRLFVHVQNDFPLKPLTLYSTKAKLWNNITVFQGRKKLTGYLKIVCICFKISHEKQVWHNQSLDLAL